MNPTEKLARSILKNDKKFQKLKNKHYPLQYIIGNTIFYGYNEYGTVILRVLPYSLMIVNLSHVVNMSLQALNKFKTIYLSTIIGLLTNALLDVPLILLFNKLGLYPFYGAILATMIGAFISLGISLKEFKNEMNFKIRTILKTIKKILLPLLVMIILVLIISKILNTVFTSRITMLITCMTSAIVGGGIYIILVYKNKLLYDIFGREYIDKILIKLKLKK